MKLVDYTTVLELKTCCRCGGEFRSDAGRICAGCRKPPARREKAPANRALTFREKQIVHLVSSAKLNKEIAYELKLAEGTIKEYLNHIFRKLQVKNRTELAIWGIQNRDLAA